MTTTALETTTPQQITPMAMLQIAVSQGADLDKLQKLMDLQERWEANEARKAFSDAFNAFKSESIRIVRNIEVTDGPLKGKRYADLFTVVDTIAPLLSKHGLGHSWKLTKDEPGWIEVTCVIRHSQGHFECVSMGGAPDTGGAKNAIQARASAKTYLERYTLLAATGMAASGQDSDGAGTKSQMDEKEFVAQMDNIQNCRTLVELQRVFANAYKLAQAAKDQAAQAAFIKSKDQKKKEISA